MNKEENTPQKQPVYFQRAPCLASIFLKNFKDHDSKIKEYILVNNYLENTVRELLTGLKN